MNKGVEFRTPDGAAVWINPANATAIVPCVDGATGAVMVGACAVVALGASIPLAATARVVAAAFGWTDDATPQRGVRLEGGGE
jgi:hypothetical protein